MEAEIEIKEELKEIKEELNYIKVHMIDRDEFMTPEEEQAHSEGMKDYREGKSVTLEEFEQEMKRVHPEHH